MVAYDDLIHVLFSVPCTKPLLLAPYASGMRNITLGRVQSSPSKMTVPEKQSPGTYSLAGSVPLSIVQSKLTVDEIWQKAKHRGAAKVRSWMALETSGRRADYITNLPACNTSTPLNMRFSKSSRKSDSMATEVLSGHEVSHASQDTRQVENTRGIKQRAQACYKCLHSLY